MTSQDEENAINSDTSHEVTLQDHAGSSMNDSGTCTEIGTPVTQWRSPTVRTLELVGFTYFIRVGRSIKIGAATNFKHRLHALQTAHVKPIKVLAVVPAAMADEYAVHQQFAHLRTRGEWFRADRELLYFIEGLNAELAERKAAELSAAPALSLAEITIRDLYSRMHTFPEHARQFARNIIEFLKNGALNVRMGDHPLQDPKLHLRRHMERFEQAMQQ